MNDKDIIFKVGNFTYKYDPNAKDEDHIFMMRNKPNGYWMMLANTFHAGEYYHDHLRIHLNKEIRRRKLERYYGRR